MLPRGLIKEYFQLFVTLLRGLDVLAVMLAGVVTYAEKFGGWHLPRYYRYAVITAGILTAIIFSSFQIYHAVRSQRFLKYISRLIQAIATVFICLAGISFFTKTGDIYSRAWFMWWIASSATLLIIFRCGLLGCLHYMRARGLNERRVIIIGGGDLGQRLTIAMQQSLWTGFRIAAIFDDAPEKLPAQCCGIPILKTPENLSDYISESKPTIDEIWLALPLNATKRVKDILNMVKYHVVTTRCVLDIFNMDLLNQKISDIAGFPVLTSGTTPMVGMNRFIKALEDRIIASIILLMIWPILLAIAIAIKCSSEGPVFYRQKRVSWNGKEFDMLKFRSMPVGTEAKSGPVWAKAGEQRATRIGAFLRRTSLDELPQFINVLKGDMSIVGPRPERSYFVDQFKEQIPRYMHKHKVKAGITGWAQVNGWRGNTSLEKRIEFDLSYIENWSLFFDLKIIFLTVFRGFFDKNAY